MEPQSKVVIALRWLGFVPGAFLCAWLVWFLISFGNMSLGLLRIDSDVANLICRGAQGAIFVYAGSRIAPTNRKIVAYVLTVVAVLFAGFMAFPAIVHQSWGDVVDLIAMVVGASFVAYQVAEGEVDLDAHRLT